MYWPDPDRRSLAVRALERRHRERLQQSMRRQTPRPRERPANLEATFHVGSVWGAVEVVAILGRGHRGRSDLRVRVRCQACGAEHDVYTFALRKLPRCSRKGPRKHA